jgi:hypothetical protein
MALYKQLVRCIRADRPSITYAELARAVGPKIVTHQRSAKLHAALGEITEACRAHRLPCLPAIVCRNDTHRPGDGYYRYAHPRARSDTGRIEAWEREHQRVRREARRFPDAL